MPGAVLIIFFSSSKTYPFFIPLSHNRWCSPQPLDTSAEGFFPAHMDEWMDYQTRYGCRKMGFYCHPDCTPLSSTPKGEEPEDKTKEEIQVCQPKQIIGKSSQFLCSTIHNAKKSPLFRLSPELHQICKHVGYIRKSPHTISAGDTFAADHFLKDMMRHSSGSHQYQSSCSSVNKSTLRLSYSPLS